MKDFSKEIIRIGHVILWRKGWYLHSGQTWEYETTMKDIREMLKYDGYEPQFLNDKEIIDIIFRAYDEYFKYAFLNDVPGWYDPLMGVIRGTYQIIVLILILCLRFWLSLLGQKQNILSYLLLIMTRIHIRLAVGNLV